MKTSLKFLLTGMASLAAVTGLSITPASAELSDFSQPTDSVSGGFGGFPQWYKDSTGLQLDLCVDASNPLCLAAPPADPSLPVSFPDNFPDEAFWWTTEATTTTTSGAKALLVMATEAAFANGDVFDGDQMVFNRTRIRILGGLKNNVKYKITYPYGVKVLTATSKDPRKVAPSIIFNEDFGCAVTATTECNFADLKAPSGNRGRILNPIGKPWLKWDNTLPAAPVGYIGDPNVDHKVTGSPFGTNFFKVEELAADGVTVVGKPVASTDLFSVSGKISTP